MSKTAKSGVYTPFNTYEDQVRNGLLDTESLCATTSKTELDDLDLGDLYNLLEEIEEGISDWEDILASDMSSYAASGYTDRTAQDDVRTDRRHIQTLRIEEREVKKRIRLMMNTENEGVYNAA